MCAIGGSQRCFCASEPSREIECIARPEWTPKNVQMLASPRASSSAIKPEVNWLMPGQP